MVVSVTVSLSSLTRWRNLLIARSQSVRAKTLLEPADCWDLDAAEIVRILKHRTESVNAGARKEQ